MCFGANNIPKNLDQRWKWCEAWLPYGKSIIHGELTLFVGQFGRIEIKHVLKGKLSKTHLRFSVMPVPLWTSGQVCFLQIKGSSWKMVLLPCWRFQMISWLSNEGAMPAEAMLMGIWCAWRTDRKILKTPPEGRWLLGFRKGLLYFLTWFRFSVEILISSFSI